MEQNLEVNGRLRGETLPRDGIELVLLVESRCDVDRKYEINLIPRGVTK